VIGRYFLDRALRIYPLYWLALTIMAILQPQLFPVSELGAWDTFLVFAGFPFVVSPLWFVVAIIQCYIFAPFLYLIYRKLRCRRYIVFNLALAVLVLLTSEEYAHVLSLYRKVMTFEFPEPTIVLYRGIFLGNVLLFSLGLMLPPLIRLYGERMRSWAIFYMCVFSLPVLTLIVRYDSLIWQRDQLLVEWAYYIGVFCFCLMTMVMRPWLPFGGTVKLLGRYSYSLYLFHDFLFQVLIMLGLFEDILPVSLAIVLALFPLLIWFCRYAERRSNAFRIWLSRFLFPA